MRVEQIISGNRVLATILYKEPPAAGIKFFTSDDNPLQVGKHSYPKGKVIKPHQHCPVTINRFATMQEVLYIEKGKLKVLVYTENGELVTQKVLGPGDMMVLMEGGHGFEVLEDLEMVEIKQGPYIPESKKALEVKS